MKSIFDFRLYKEGFKRVRVAGIALSLICVVTSALVAFTAVISAGPVSEVQIDDRFLQTDFIAPTLILLLISTPAFICSMFSFLTRRGESDFYHSIPAKRSCVFLSFMAAAVTWLWGIVLASTAVASIIWAIGSFSISFGAVITIIINYFIATLLVAAITAIAFSATGTNGSAFVLAFLLLFMLRIVGGLVTLGFEDAVPIVNTDYTVLKYLEPYYFLPIGIFMSLFSLVENTVVLYNATLLIYSFVLALAALAVGTLVYTKRKSETACKNAPNKYMQVVYRCAFTLPAALLTGYLIVYGAGIELFLILSVITALIYFLYELFTQKSWKKMLSCAPMFLAIVAACGIYVGGIYAARSFVIEQEITADKIEAVCFDGEAYRQKTFEDINTDGLMTSDAAAREAVASALSIAQEKLDGQYDSNKQNRIYKSVRIKLKNGSTIGRIISLTEKELETVSVALMESEAYIEKYLELPSPDDFDFISVLTPLSSISNRYGDADYGKEIFAIYKIFREEYVTLSPAQKYEVKSNVSGYEGGFSNTADAMPQFRIYVINSSDTSGFSSQYSVPPYMQKTAAAILSLISEVRFDGEGFAALLSDASRIADSFLTVIDVSTDFYNYNYCFAIYDNNFKDALAYISTLDFESVDYSLPFAFFRIELQENIPNTADGTYIDKYSGSGPVAVTEFYAVANVDIGVLDMLVSRKIIQ